MSRNYHHLTYSPEGGGLAADLPQRLTTICVGVPVLWILFSYPGTRQSFFQGVHAIMCWEWMKLTSDAYADERHTGLRFILLSIVLANIRDAALFLFVLLTVLAMSYIMESHLHASTSFWTGLMLITIPCRTWLLLQDNFHHTVSLLLVVWNGDTAALIAGRCWRHWQCHMYTGYDKYHRVVQDAFEPDWLKRISPAKSTIGLLGGVIGSTITYCLLPMFWSIIHSHQLAPSSYIDDLSMPLLFSGSSSSGGMSSATAIPSPTYDSYYYYSSSSSSSSDSSSSSSTPPHPVMIGLTLGLTAVLGDLWESAVKRAYGAKDMSRLLPGHGGVLDRFDSSLLAVLLYHYYVEHGLV